MHFGEIPSPLCERHVADARLHKALHRRSVDLFTEEKTLRERLQWVEKREAQAAWREVSLMRREEAVARREEEVTRRKDALPQKALITKLELLQ